MPEELKQPDITPPDDDAASKPADNSSSQIDPQSHGASQADVEKNSRVEEAKARVSAAKEAITAKTTVAPAAPKAPVKKKEEGPKPSDASDHPLVKRLRAKLNRGVIGAIEFLGQVSIGIERSRIVD